MEILLAIIIGMAFGFVLNRIGATNPHYIITMMRLTDLHLMKTILLAVGLSSLLLFAGLATGLIETGNLSVKESYIGVVIGGVLLGIGFAVAGYCPGTGLCAAATGRYDGLVFVLGGLFGALVYTLMFSSVSGTGLLDGIWGGKVTLAATGSADYPALLMGLPGLLIAGIFGVGFMALARFLPEAPGAGVKDEDSQ